MLRKDRTTVTDIQKLHGYLNYVACVFPFGRPFLAPLTTAICGLKRSEPVRITRAMTACLGIWDAILAANEGLSFNFILGRLPRCPDEIFVDASTEWGIGGYCGDDYFLFPWTELSVFGANIIVEKELLACLIAIFCFSLKVTGKIVRLWSDNTSTVQWLQKGRSSNTTGTKYLACWELQKYRLRCKISPRWVPGDMNVTADALSRGTIPEWLESRGNKCVCNLDKVAYETSHPELSWRSIV